MPLEDIISQSLATEESSPEGQESTDVAPENSDGDSAEQLNATPETSDEEGGSKETTEQAQDGDDTAATPATEEAPPQSDEISKRDQEIKELRQILRDAKRQISTLREKVSGVEKLTRDQSLDGNAEVEKGVLTKLQEQLSSVANSRSAALEVLAETMSLSPLYQDIYDVCTRARFDDIFEVAAAAEAQRSGKPVEQALLEVELDVWKQPNPYKYMYNVIKKYHPDFAGKTQQQKTEASAQQQTKSTPVVAPSSISGMGGGGATGQGGWTSARIDAMDVSELDSVPADVYQKYLLGTLK